MDKGTIFNKTYTLSFILVLLFQSVYSANLKVELGEHPNFGINAIQQLKKLIYTNIKGETFNVLMCTGNGTVVSNVGVPNPTNADKTQDGSYASLHETNDEIKLAPVCELTITTTYSDNCTEPTANNFTANWKIGFEVSSASDNAISYQRNSDAVQMHTLTETTDTLTISGIPADGGVYDTLKIWFTNEITCGDTIILKRPVPCPSNVTGCIVSNTTTFLSASYGEENNSSGSVALTSSDIELVEDGVNQTVGILFSNINIPQGAIISSAHLQFQADESVNTNPISLTLEGQDEDNPNFFVDINNDISNRIRTTASVNWSPSDWTAGEEGAAQQSPDIDTIVQEIVNRPGWDLGQNMAFIITGSGKRVAETSVKLVVSYTGIGDCTLSEICSSIQNTSVRGSVWEDYNYNGAIDEAIPTGVQGIQVQIYDCNNNLVGTTYTGENGVYEFSGLNNGEDYRVEFVLPENVSCWAKPTQYGIDNGTTVQFVQPGECASLGIANPVDYCESDPWLVTSCYVFGDQISGSYNTDKVVIATRYSWGGDTSVQSSNLADYQVPNLPSPVADANEVGTTWGIAYQKSTQTVYLGAYMKQFSGFGSGGQGAIYKVEINKTTGEAVGAPTLFADVGAHSSLCDESNSQLLHGDDLNEGTPINNDSRFDAVGKCGLGDVEISEDESTLYTVNLNTKEVIAFNTSDGSLKGIYAIPTSALPSDGSTCPIDDVRPFGLGYNKGTLYVGAVCSGQSSMATAEDRNDLHAYIFTMDDMGNFTLVSDQKMRSNLKSDWYVWKATMAEVRAVAGTTTRWPNHPQPMLTDIDFNGDYITVAFRDRFGDQWGSDIPDPLYTGTGDNLTTATARGDVYCVYWNGSEYEWEAGGVCGDFTGSALGYGDTNGEFFWGDGSNPTFDPTGIFGHNENSMGGITQIPGFHLAITEVNPSMAVGADIRFGGGIGIKNTVTGAPELGYFLYQGQVEDGLFSKANGLGDLEALCAPAPLEVGNYVWEDTDGDGIQDACEPGIENVRVELYSSVGVLLAFDTTDANGQYYFSHSDSTNQHWVAITDSVAANTIYHIVVGNGNFTANQLSLSGNDYTLTIDSTDSGANRYLIDSDAEVVISSPANAFDNLPATEITTGDWGNVDHSFDFGFRPATCTDTICLDQHVLVGTGEYYKLNWNPNVSGWVTPPDDANSYPHTQTIALEGTTITADITLSHRANDTNLADEHYACPSGCENNIDLVAKGPLLGSDTVFRFWKPTADSIITVNLVFSEPILLHEIGMGGPASTGGGTILSAWDDSISVNGNQRLDTLNANSVLPLASVHPNPGVNHFHTDTDDPTLESTVNYYAHDAMGSYNWGASGTISTPAPAPINYMDEFPGEGAGSGGDILTGQQDGFYFNLSRGNKRSWVTIDYAGAKVKSLSWQLIDEDDGTFDAALNAGTADIGDYFDYVITGNRSAYWGGFTIEKLVCPDTTYTICLDGSGATTVDISADASKTSNIIWYNSDTVQVGTGTTLTVSASTLGMADSTEVFFYSGTDIATGCFGYACCPFTVNAASCCPTDAGLTNQLCSDNGTPSIASDDYIYFDLNPIGINLTGSYTVAVNSGTITPTTGTYGAVTTFQLQNGSIGSGDIIVTLIDDTDTDCTLMIPISDPGECVYLKLIKTADKASATVGDTIFYTYQVVNNGPDDLTLSDITDDKLGSIETEIAGAVRVTDDLQALYRFEDGSGTTVSDNSGVSPAFDLTIEGTNNTWGADSLDFTGANRASNSTDNSKIYSSITSSGAFTVEAWIQPDNNTQGGAARIISQSLNSSNRNFQLMQNGNRYQFRMRTSGDGTNEQSTSTGIISASPTLQHVVFTYDGTTPQFYINGTAVVTTGSAITGDFSTWDAAYDFGIGNEFSVAEDDAARDWQGEFHLAAVYSKALSSAEVSTNYTQGTGPLFVDNVILNGDTATYTAFYKVTGTEIENPYKNIATITGTPAVGAPLTATDSASVSLGACKSITDLITTRTICSGENVDTLAVLTTFENPDSIAFVYFTSPQTDSSLIYTSGIGIDTVQIAIGNDTARITDVSGFTSNSGTTTYYVYAIAHPVPDDMTCRPYEEMIVHVKSVITLDLPDVEICGGDTATIVVTIGNGGSKPTLTTWTVPVGENDPGLIAYSFEATTAGNYILSASNNGCTVVDTAVLTVKPTPTASVFAIQPSCDNGMVQSDGYLQISAYANGDKYNFSDGSTYTGDPDYVDAFAIGALPFKFHMNRPNPTVSQDYTVRIFNANGCYTDYTITMNQQDCNIGCNCKEYVYLNDTDIDATHKFLVNSDSTLTEIGNPWMKDSINDPHAVFQDNNGYIYIGEADNFGGQAAVIGTIKKYNTSLELLNDDVLGGTDFSYNILSKDNVLYVPYNNTKEIRAFDLCTGALIGKMTNDTSTIFSVYGAWGFYIDDEYWYLAQRRTGDIVRGPLDSTQFTDPATVTGTVLFNTGLSSNFGIAPMGLTRDAVGNFYVVMNRLNGNGATPEIRKFSLTGTLLATITDATNSGNATNGQTGFWGARGIVYSEDNNLLYVSSFDNCISVFDTNLVEQTMLNIGNPDASEPKGIHLLTECCPINNNITIDTILCDATLNQKLYLQDFLCMDILAEGEWTAVSSTDMSFDPCDNSITLTALDACGSFTLSSNGTGSNAQCGAFIITINISVGNIIAPILTGNQTICNGGDPTTFIVSTPASGSNAISYQWQSTTDTLMGYTDIPSATDSVYDPPNGITDTTYYRVIATVVDGCSSGNCQDTSKVIIIMVVDCDYGDLPDKKDGTAGISDYETYDSTGGPSHQIIAGLFLGDTVDVDTDGFPDSLAIGDDMKDGYDDEDGVIIYPTLDITPGSIIRLPLSVTNMTGDTAYVEAWIDWNGDGDLDNLTEIVLDIQDNEDGVFPTYMEIMVPIDAVTGSLLGFRIRLSNTPNMTPYGRVDSGEIEDYLLGIDCPQSVCLPIEIELKRE